ncbi:MAG: hypothetical protein ACJAXL_000962 [Alphaproteobacteria bacterium]|jgi:hypothetical protein
MNIRRSKSCSDLSQSQSQSQTRQLIRDDSTLTDGAYLEFSTLGIKMVQNNNKCCGMPVPSFLAKWLPTRDNAMD